MGKLNFDQYFEKYQELVKKAEAAFNAVEEQHGDEVKCKKGCSDCCHALFDLTLIEALYVNHQFLEKFADKERVAILEKANRADRKIYKLKRDAFRALERGKNEVDILGQMAGERVRCPLLNEDNLCDLYEHRPITCRLYGIPTASNGMSHTCGLSGFSEGKPYPTVNLDIIHQTLYAISAELVEALKTKYIKMAEMLVPVSMALLTEYNEEYLGLKDPKDRKNGPDKK